MKLGLTFAPDATISGDGIDDIAPFTIHGSFDVAKNEARWTKAYVRMHSVEYAGLYDGRSICGTWILTGITGGFWIWPAGLEDNEALKAEVELPAELVPI